MSSEPEFAEAACSRCEKTRHVQILTATLAAGHPDYGTPSRARILAIKRALNALMNLRLSEDHVWDARTRSALRRFRERRPALDDTGASEGELFEAPSYVPAPRELVDGAFEGGGAKGTGFLGALAFMEQNGMWFKRVAGTSAGSITAALIAAGYRARSAPGQETLETIVMNTDFRPLLLDYPESSAFTDADIERNELFQALRTGIRLILPVAPLLSASVYRRVILNNSGVVRLLTNLMERGGLFAAERFRVWLNDKIRARIQALGVRAPSAEPTFREVQAATKISLTVFAADLRSQQSIVFNEQTTPNVPVARAVRMSAGIPFVFNAVPFQTCSAVDGGVYLNFPLSFFTQSNPFLRGGPDDNKRRKIGFLLDEGGAKQPIAPDKCPAGPPLSGEALLFRVADTMAQLFQCGGLSASFTELSRLTMKIDVSGFGMLEFGMTGARKRALAHRGWVAAARHFKQPGSKSPYSP